MSTEVTLKQIPNDSAFSLQSFEHAQRVAKMLSASDLIPQVYKNNIQNTMIALEMANRIGASPLMVMQNLNVIQGKPSWGSSFIIAAINKCGDFSKLNFALSGSGDDLSCFAYAKELATDKEIKGPTVTIAMAIAEGWVSKAGSKWKTMPELMIQYRAAAFFGRLHKPELLMGMQSSEELSDTSNSKTELPQIELNSKINVLKAYVAGQITAETKDELLLTFE
jgi:hypothetical protein